MMTWRQGRVYLPPRPNPEAAGLREELHSPWRGPRARAGPLGAQDTPQEPFSGRDPPADSSGLTRGVEALALRHTAAKLLPPLSRHLPSELS